MISMKQLRYFVEIAEHGSFSVAAQRLFIAQSALSRQMKELENNLGTLLFERTARQPHLTPAGLAFLPRAKVILSDVDSAARLATSVGNGQRGALRLSHASTVPLTGKLKDALGLYLERMTDVYIEVSEESSETQLMNLVDNRIDAGLFRLPVLHQMNNIKLLPLFSEKVVVAVGSTHPLASRSSISLAELRDEAFVSIAHPKRGGLSYLSFELCARAGFAPKSAQVYSLKTTQSLLIQAGFGIALLPVSMVKATSLHAIDISDEGCESEVVLAHHERDSTLVETFVEHFREAFYVD
ncbi:MULTISPECIES: LysR family transcriptional regulator [Pseudomonas]|jgi:DNA-binding transcriptional LysR family regulator|uniref:LysR family transcriptional regulator n=1 Tax=Pseudomonas fluorescens TaxID=294 RepID=A0A2N1EAE3_PSEFL|nr:MULTISPECIES: LysR family transcriptional regulator [Pseudomonas]PKH23395.1 LysR family transcriptional regulator [Pseudomonas fluorescens]TKK35135.1 LysR family transcriptional regulator [Pseudomonas sp. CFBP13528]CRM57138.1 HTH-type transcriptional regulator GltC [Pseudomonas sp. 37 R 15]